MRPARAALLPALVLGLAACPLTEQTGECMQDRDCGGGEVCGRDSLCYAAGSVRAVRVTWTVNGAPATEASCAGREDLAVTFLGDYYGEALTFAPVPCFTGQFTIDKLPAPYRYVELGREGGYPERRAIDGSNAVAFDLR